MSGLARKDKISNKKSDKFGANKCELIVAKSADEFFLVVQRPKKCHESSLKFL